MTVSEQRRARLVTRHLLDGSARSAVAATKAVVALHASDPATVYLSALARGNDLRVGDIDRELYDDRSLVRMMGMRRTLFVIPADLIAVVHHGVALEVAARMRRRLVTMLATGPTDPSLPTDVEQWLTRTQREVEAFVSAHGPVDGTTIAEAVPAVRTELLPRTTRTWDVRRAVTSNVLSLMAAEGLLVRGRPGGSWTSRRHTWEAASAWWPNGTPQLTLPQARAGLLEAYLRAFGPVSEADAAWWTGWNLGDTRAALDSLPTTELDGGLVMADDTDPAPTPEPVACLLPALDPTPMGWKERAWFLPEDSSGLYDRNGNIGPTVWWAGEVVGAWAVRADGEVVTRLLADRGEEAAMAVEQEAARLTARTEGKPVVPTFPTPWERELRQTPGETGAERATRPGGP